MKHLSHNLSTKILARINQDTPVEQRAIKFSQVARITLVTTLTFLLVSCTTEQQEAADNTESTFRKVLGIFKTIKQEAK